MKSKIKVTQQQRDNALEALNVMWPSVPPENVSRRLSSFTEGAPNVRRATDCNTIACFGGWACRWPAFRQQGAKLNPWGGPRIRHADDYEVAGKLFGDARMFLPRGCLDFDAGFIGTDHELVTHRLRWLIENSEVTA